MQEIKTQLKALLASYDAEYNQAIEKGDARAEKRAATLEAGVAEDLKLINDELESINLYRQNMGKLLELLEKIKAEEVENMRKYQENKHSRRKLKNH